MFEPLIYASLIIEQIVEQIKRIVNEGKPNWYALGASILGSASGAWTARQDLITVHIHDISTATDIYVPIINAGTVSKLQTVTSAAIAGSDLIITAYNSSSASMGNLTVTQSGSAAGDVDEKLPTSNNTVAAGSYIRINSNGGPSSHVDVMLIIAVDRTS